MTIGLMASISYKNQFEFEPIETSMVNSRTEVLAQLGYRFGISGPHAARTMMLEDLGVLFSAVLAEAPISEYSRVANEQNALGKPTKKSRELAFRHLLTLYGFDNGFPLFRMFRRLWDADEQARPLLALTMALARDPLLFGTKDFILQKQLGEHVSREDLEVVLEQLNPDRFSPASLKSLAQNVNGTWTAAGYLTGKNRKVRTHPTVTPANVTMCLFMAYLEGMSGQRLFNSSWCRLLQESDQRLETLGNAAYHRGLIVFLNAGGVKEVRFPDSLNPSEDRLRQEITHEL